MIVIVSCMELLLVLSTKLGGKRCSRCYRADEDEGMIQQYGIIIHHDMPFITNQLLDGLMYSSSKLV